MDTSSGITCAVPQDPQQPQPETAPGPHALQLPAGAWAAHPCFPGELSQEDSLVGINPFTYLCLFARKYRVSIFKSTSEAHHKSLPAGKTPAYLLGAGRKDTKAY